MNNNSKQKHTWIKDTLTNDEESTDAELVEYFVINGLSLEDAVLWVCKRDEYMGKI